MNTTDAQAQRGGFIAAVLYLILLALLLLFLSMRAERMKPDPGSMEMALGFSEDGFGENIPVEVNETGGGDPIPADVMASEAASDVQVNQTTTQPVRTNNPAPNPNPNTGPAQTQRNEFDDLWQDAKPGSSGSTQGTGNSGGPTGRPGSNGSGGKGSSVGNAFGNGDATSLPKPSVNSGEDGVVVMQVCVDKSGRVSQIVSDRLRNSNATSPELYAAARKAAMQATFPPDPQAQDCRVAILTYNYVKGNAR
jgi:hypothetical protein